MLTIQTGQLMVRGLAPLKYDSLVGYSVCYRPSRWLPLERMRVMASSDFFPSGCGTLSLMSQSRLAVAYLYPNVPWRLTADCTAHSWPWRILHLFLQGLFSLIVR